MKSLILILMSSMIASCSMADCSSYARRTSATREAYITNTADLYIGAVVGTTCHF